MAAAKAAATLEQKLKSLVDAVDADAASQVYAGAFGGLSLGESVKQGPAPPSSWSEGDGVKTATAVYAGAAQALEQLASKAPLVLQEPSVTTEAAQAICKDVEKAANELQTAAALLQTDTAGAGAPLRAIARVNGRRLLDAWRLLAEALKTNKDVPQKTGVAWEAAQMCHKIPKSNRTAYRREFLQWAKELKDVRISASRRVEAPSLHSNDSCPSHDEVGGFSFAEEAIRTEPGCSAQAQPAAAAVRCDSARPVESCEHQRLPGTVLADGFVEGSFREEETRHPRRETDHRGTGVGEAPGEH